MFFDRPADALIYSVPYLEYAIYTHTQYTYNYSYWSFRANEEEKKSFNLFNSSDLSPVLPIDFDDEDCVWVDNELFARVWPLHIVVKGLTCSVHHCCVSRAHAKE